MTTIGAPPGGQYAKADEVQRLKVLVESLQKRLDYMEPMMKMITNLDNYKQSVEIEAQVQIQAMKNKVKRTKHSSADDEELVNADLETVKWLHFMTDAVVAINNPPPPGSATPQLVSGYSSSPALASAFPSLGAMEDIVSDRRPSQAGMVPPARGSPLVSVAAPRTEAQPRPAFGSLPSRAEAQPALRATPDEIRIRPDSFLGSMALGSKSEEPVAVSAANSTMPQSIAMSDGGGLLMGRGSWATAYRQASGQRQEALRLLCTSGIVTARELSDDLTVISEEHIGECVQIATEMLQTWTIEMWNRQPQEAKKFFEERLCSMYQPNEHSFPKGS